MELLTEERNGAEKKSDLEARKKGKKNHKIASLGNHMLKALTAEGAVINFQ